MVTFAYERLFPGEKSPFFERQVHVYGTVRVTDITITLCRVRFLIGLNKTVRPPTP